jgi:hypothetical protein
MDREFWPSFAPGKQRSQGVEVDRFGEMTVTSGRQRLKPALLVSVTGNRSDDERSGQFLPKHGGDVVAIQCWQTEIEQDKTRLLESRDLDCLASLAGRFDFMAPHSKQYRHRVGAIAVIIYDKNVCHVDLPRCCAMQCAELAIVPDAKKYRPDRSAKPQIPHFGTLCSILQALRQSGKIP